MTTSLLHRAWVILATQWPQVITLDLPEHTGGSSYPMGLLSIQLLIQILNGPRQFCCLILYPFSTSFSPSQLQLLTTVTDPLSIHLLSSYYVLCLPYRATVTVSCPQAFIFFISSKAPKDR